MNYREFKEQYGDARVELYDSDENCIAVDLAYELDIADDTEVVITSQFENIFCLTIDSCENEV
jgi:hypothetical protein